MRARLSLCHLREGGDPVAFSPELEGRSESPWIPADAGMAIKRQTGPAGLSGARRAGLAPAPRYPLECKTPAAWPVRHVPRESRNEVQDALVFARHGNVARLCSTRSGTVRSTKGWSGSSRLSFWCLGGSGDRSAFRICREWPRCAGECAGPPRIHWGSAHPAAGPSLF